MGKDEAKAESKDKKEEASDVDNEKVAKVDDEDGNKGSDKSKQKDIAFDDEVQEDDEQGEDSDKGGRKKRGSDDKEAPASSGREKRARKSAVVTAYKPEDFSNVDNSPNIIEGKGIPIGDMEKAKESIESYKDNAEELAMAYRFLFAPRGRLNVKEIKSSLLQFNGYIPKPAEGDEEADIKKAESAAEKKFAARAYKLVVPQLKKILDVFAVDRSDMKDKEALVEGVLNFFSEPSEDMLKSGTKKTAVPAKKKEATKKKSKVKAVKKTPESESESELEDVEEGKEPDEKELRKWVRAYVRCFNTSSATLKHAMGVAEEKFGVSLKEKKELMKKILTEEM